MIFFKGEKLYGFPEQATHEVHKLSFVNIIVQQKNSEENLYSCYRTDVAKICMGLYGTKKLSLKLRISNSIELYGIFLVMFLRCF